MYKCALRRCRYSSLKHNSRINNGKKLKSKNLHLLISICIIVPVALVYGLAPKRILNEIFKIQFWTPDLSGIFRAIMGLYIAMSIFWIIGIIRPRFWIAATLSNVLFMVGLALGRIVSLILDGIPSYIFLIGIIIEVILAIWGIINLRKYKL